MISYRIFSRYRSELMGVAMLWVMLFHASDLDMGLPLLEAVRAAGFGGVDIFILLSAMGLVMSLSRQEREYGDFLSRRAARVLPAYYVVMLPYTLFLIVTQGKPWASLLWNSTLLYYWMRSSGAFNWYVAGIMTFYAITPACFRIWKRSAHRAGLTAVAVLLSLGVCQVLTHEGYWYATDFFYRVPVFFLGLLIGFYGVADRKLTRGGLLFWLAVLAAGMGYFLVSQYANWIDWPIHFPLCHLFLFTTVPMCLILCLCFAYLPLGWLRRFLRLVGENSLEIYLLNVSLFALTTPLRDTVLPSPTHRLFYLVSFALNLALGVALHWLVSRAVVILNQWRNSYAAKHPCCR